MYETDDFDYTKLARLHDQMAEMYRAIVDKNQMRMEPQYYRVSFWGKNHPAVIQNKTFVYRGKPRGTEDVPARYYLCTVHIFSLRSAIKNKETKDLPLSRRISF